MPQNVDASIIMITRLVDPAVYIYGGWADPKYSITFFIKLLLHCLFVSPIVAQNINSSCQSSQDLLKGCGYAPSYDDGCIEALCFSHGVLQHLYNCTALSNGNAAFIVYRGSGMLNQIADCWCCPELHCWCDTVALGTLWANSKWQ